MNKSISFSFLADGTLSKNDEDDTSNKGSNRQPISTAPPIKPLTSYVSEPASTMQALHGYAVAELQAINNSTSSTSAAASASAPTRTSPSTLNHALWAPTPSSMHIYDHPLAGELAISTASKPAVDNIFLSYSPRRARPPQLPPLLDTSSTGGSGNGGEIRQRRIQQGGNVVLGPNPATAPSTTNYNRRSIEGFSVHSGHGHDNASITSCDDNNNGKNKKGGGGDGGSQMGDIDWEDEDYAYDNSGNKKQFWMKKKFWKYVVPPLVFSSIFIVIGVIFLTEASANSISDLEIWRMCFFLAGLPFVWWFGMLCTATFVWVVESSMFTWKGALYFAYAVRKPLANVIRAAVALGWWALMLTVDNNTMNSSAKDAYTIILKLWACVTLFMTANLLKRLLAKILASKFHKTSHMENMMKSLRRERWLHILLWPRDKLFHDDDDGSGGAMLLMNGGKDGVKLEKQDRGASMPIALDEKQSRRKLGSALLRKSISMFRSNGRGSGGGDPNQHGNNSSRLQAISEEEDGEGDVDIGVPTNRMTTTGRGGLPTMAFEDGTYFDDDTDTEGQKVVDIEAPIIRRRTSDNSTTSIKGGAPPPVSSSPSTGPAGVVHTRSATLPARHLTVAINTAGTNNGGSDPSSDMSGHGYRSPSYSGGNRLPRVGPFAGGGMNTPPMMQSPTISPKKRGGLQPSTGSGHMPPASPLKRQTSTASGQQYPTSPSVADTVRGKGGLNKKRPSVLNISGKLDAQKLAKMEKYIRKSTLTLTFRDELNRTQKSKASVTVVEAKKMAFYLWVNVRANPESSCITVADLRDFLPEDSEAEEAHAMLDADNDGTVTFKDCCNALMAIIEERANLAATLKDAKSVVSTLETLIGVIIHTIFLFIYLIIFEVNVMETYLGLSSLVLAFSFVFGNSIRTMFENVIFLFVVHPFDIGDTIFFEDNYHKVEEINLHFTCFNRADNARVWYPNQKLVQNSFINLNYSGNRGEPIQILIDIDTPASALEKIENALKHVVDENPKEFGGYPSAGLRQATDPLKVTLYIWFEFSHNGIDLGRCRQARTKLYLTIFDVINKLGIKYTWPEQKQAEMSKLGALPGGVGGGGREELRETFIKDDSGSSGAAVLAAQQMLMQQNLTMNK